MARRKKRKSKKGLIITLVILIAAAGGAAGWYFYERQQPVNTVKEYLAEVSAMNFEGMQTYLQSSDLSALDNADITNDAYSGFFQTINQKMTFDIVKTKFSIQNGTARVTARIKYIDGTDIYKETLTEFLKQIVSTAFAGESLTEEETQEKLASILNEKAQIVEDSFTEEDITYPLILASGEWKIVSLDSDTVRIMSGNFTNVQEQITQSITDAETGTDSTADTSADGTAGGSDAADTDTAEQVSSESSDGAAGETAAETAGDSPESSAAEVSGSGTIDMTNDYFTLHYTSFRVAEDFAGASCLMVYYDYTNNGSSPSSAMVDISLRAYQNGEVLEAAIPAADDTAVDQYMSEVNPGQTVSVCQVFSLKDTSDVTLEAGEALTLGGGETASQVLKVQ